MTVLMSSSDSKKKMHACRKSLMRYELARATAAAQAEVTAAPMQVMLDLGHQLVERVAEALRDLRTLGKVQLVADLLVVRLQVDRTQTMQMQAVLEPDQLLEEREEALHGLPTPEAVRLLEDMGLHPPAVQVSTTRLRKRDLRLKTPVSGRSWKMPKRVVVVARALTQPDPKAGEAHLLVEHRHQHDQALALIPQVREAVRLAPILEYLEQTSRALTRQTLEDQGYLRAPTVLAPAQMASTQHPRWSVRRPRMRA